jgi:hypothetical protein
MSKNKRGSTSMPQTRYRFEFAQDVQPAHDAAKDCVLVVEVLTRFERDKKLRAICVAARIRHA